MKKVLAVGLPVILFLTTAIFAVLYFKLEKEKTDLVYEKKNLEQRIESISTSEGFINSVYKCSDTFINEISDIQKYVTYFDFDYVSTSPKYLLVEYLSNIDNSAGSNLAKCRIDLIPFLELKTGEIVSRSVFFNAEPASIIYREPSIYYVSYKEYDNTSGSKSVDVKLNEYNLLTGENKVLKEYKDSIVYIEFSSNENSGIEYHVGLVGSVCESTDCGQGDKIGNWYYDPVSEKHIRME